LSRRSDNGRPDLRLVDVTCTHCGLPVPRNLIVEGEEEQFCCSGCRQVYAILHDWGFDDGYYRLLDQADGRGAPASPSGRKFEDFDDPAFRDQHVESRGSTNVVRFYLEGVHCAACVWLVEELPRAVGGLVSVRLNLASSVAEVTWDPDSVELSSIARALDAIGYTPHARREGDVERVRRAEDRALLIKLGVAAACAMNIMFIHGALYAGEHHGIEPRFEQFFRWISFALALPVMLFSAQTFFRSAWAGLRQRVPHMDLPIAIALLGAFTYSAVSTIDGAGPIYFDSLAALVALLLGARYLQQRAQRAALERAESLRGVAFVEFARKLDPLGISIEVPVPSLQPGDRVEVRSGELIPVDGVVLDGTSSVDCAVLTGEPDPISVTTGDAVVAGATNLGGRLVVDVVATGAETRVGALLALVDEAMSKRAPIVQLADRISRVFVLVVFGLAVVAGAVAWFRTTGDPGAALEQVVALLVVTCPCALGLATPVALTVGLSRAARAGLFIKNPDAIELLGSIDTILLDKTGTLTEGAATVASWHGAEGARDLAFALESQSAHPVAQAFRRSFTQPVRSVRGITDVRETGGRGITGRVDDHGVAIGNREYIESLGMEMHASTAEWIDAVVAAGESPVLVAVDGEVVATAGIGDPLRPDAAETIATLTSRGLTPVILSGDHPAVVARVAREIGIPADAAHGGMTPEDKHAWVERWLDSHTGRVMMVGDGVNDAAALALAHVGIAVHGGAGASIVAADVVLTRPGLGPVLDLFNGSRRVLRVVHRNLAFSLVYNLVGASLAIAGIVGPLLAALLMPASSLTVILSSAVGRTFVPTRARPGRER
jgi:Cu2+-exporting ATPase